MRPRRALVTGGNRGIGRAIAAGLVAQGHAVTITARTQPDGQEAAEALGCQYMLTDLSNPETMMGVLQPPEGFDILINNAGILPRGSLLENPEGYFDCMAVMVNAPFLLIQALAPGMVDRRWGRIVNISSDWGSFAEGLHGPNAYGVAKAALNALTMTLPRDLPAGVKVNAMCPGWVQTRMGGAGATRTPEDAADTAVWLANLPDDGPTGGFFRDRKPLNW
ncbi:SDR family NAD(P)-dependent oxidoreductase [Actibacterium sp. 188UL27-1]|uniref:SDR family NAD(P)-dependent oxidoreductase n=1 Tax=Actibacterium sp. 188UL27-1 TaxID=2786961 RepID=UPI00195791FD|nr:SDR family NAD(P)-dependent oxidoreductase [Actibacterium sp. 188UL27-1]MBM7068458.1 SDR family NAD(P)-dependent oxidoreductase [Actibacterium sp. 188UL27-1]